MKIHPFGPDLGSKRNLPFWITFACAMTILATVGCEAGPQKIQLNQQNLNQATISRANAVLERLGSIPQQGRQRVLDTNPRDQAALQLAVKSDPSIQEKIANLGLRLPPQGTQK